jgi:hypothetical protein
MVLTIMGAVVGIGRAERVVTCFVRVATSFVSSVIVSVRRRICFCVSASLALRSWSSGSLTLMECFWSWYRTSVRTNLQIGPSSAVMVLVVLSVWCCADFQVRKLARVSVSRSVLHSPVRTAVQTVWTGSVQSRPPVFLDWIKTVRPVRGFSGLQSTAVDCSRLPRPEYFSQVGTYPARCGITVTHSHLPPI